MKNQIFKTENSFIPTLLRMILALVVFPHGAQKLLGWFGGYGFTGTMAFFSETIGLPWIVGFTIIMLESFGALALFAGFGTRILAISYSFLALGILFTSHVQNGFFMNWFGNQPGEGYEYFILWLGISLALILSGGGKYSFDRHIGSTAS